MPSTHQSSDSRERLHCETIADRLGEDPARWLDWDLQSHAGRRAMVASLIEGIDSLERVRAWRAVERRLAARDDREPRETVTRQLDAREAWLERHGERPERLPAGPRRPCTCCSDEDGITPTELRARDNQEAQRLVATHAYEGVDTDQTSSTTAAATLGEFASERGDQQ